MKNIFLLIVGLILPFSNVYPQWEVCNNGLGEGQFTSIGICGDKIIAGNNSTGIFLTTDNGDSWTDKTAGLPHKNLLCIIADGDKIFVSNDGRVYLSTNYGGNWSEKSGGLPNDAIVSSFSKKGNKLFAVTAKGVFMTSDDGVSWTEKNNGIDQDDRIKLLKIIAFENDLFIGGFGCTYLSSDDGESWTKRISGVEMFWVEAFAVSGNYLISGNNSDIGIYISSNKGENWTRTLNNKCIASLTSTGSYVFAGTHFNGMFYSTDNGNTWAEANDGLTDTDVLSVAVSKGYLFAGTGYRIFRKKLSEFGISGVDEVYTDQGSFSVMPNPIHNNIKICCVENSQNKSMAIYDLMGKKVFEAELKEQSEEFNLDFLSPGAYIVRIGSISKIIIKKT